MSLKGSQQRPLIFEIEDLHWIDHTSQDYLASFVESLPGCCHFAADHLPSWLPPPMAREILCHASLPAQSGTARRASQSSARLGNTQALPAHLEQVIIEKAQGNPFFLEELTRAVIEHGDLQHGYGVSQTRFKGC